MKIVLMGIQGSGKGTQAKLISDYYHIPHISVGDMFKQVIANGGPLGELVAGYVNSGKLVPDEITVEVVKDRVNKADCQNGYILDGYPRTINQADLFLEGNSIDHVLFFELDEQIVLDRVSKRRV